MTMRLEDYDVGQRHKATVTQTKRITPSDTAEDIRSIHLHVDAGDFHFDVGQSIGVVVPGPHEFGHAEHFRLYTVADILGTNGGGQGTDIEICVKRCAYIDEFSGERHDGIASNYLCDRQSGDEITVTGPYGLPFALPAEKSADLLMIGLGTGIAPFRAFVRHLYESLGGWEGRVRLYYGARSGLEMAYMNDEQNDFVNYYDEKTFKAFTAVSPRPHMDDPVPLDEALQRNRDEVWEMVRQPDTHVYVAGLEHMLPQLDKAFAGMAGSEETWERRKAELIAGKRWTQLVY
jgi:ferredoxin--NADP+ reductase